MTDTPTLDELPAPIDEGLRLVDERLAASPDARIYDSIKAQLLYVRAVVHGKRRQVAADDDRLLLNRYAAREFETSDPPFADVLFKVHYLYERCPVKPQPSPLGKRGNLVLLGIVAVVIASVMIGSGVFLLVQRQTGTRARATVADCVTSGGGRYASTHCTGSWVIGGSLIDGGHVVVGTIDGVDKDAVGKTIDVTLRGDTAYSRDLVLPLLLIGLGVIPAVGVVLRVRPLFRAR